MRLVYFVIYHWQWYILQIFAHVSNINVSQGSVVIHLRCDGIVNDDFTTNLLKNLSVKKFWKSVNISQSDDQDCSGSLSNSQCRMNRGSVNMTMWQKHGGVCDKELTNEQQANHIRSTKHNRQQDYLQATQGPTCDTSPIPLAIVRVLGNDRLSERRGAQFADAWR